MSLAEFVFSETCPTTASGAGPSINPVTGGGTGGGTSGSVWTAAWPLSDYDTLEIEAELVGSTGGTTDVYVQSSSNGTDWYDCVHFPQLANGASAIIYRTAITRHPQPTSAAPVVIGKNSSPQLAASTTVQGGWGDRLRLWMVPGATVTVGGAVTVKVNAARSTQR